MTVPAPVGAAVSVGPEAAPTANEPAAVTPPVAVPVAAAPVAVDAACPHQGFYGLGIAPKLLEALDKLNFKTPTPIQSKAIPAAIEGKDIIGVAQTGTGKTVAFGVPILQRLARLKGRGLVVLPTRELALQVSQMLLDLGRIAHLRTAVLIGGASMDNQIREIRAKPHVVIGTPGRIIDHLERRTLDLKDVNVLVLDEADRMLDMGFLPQISRILRHVPRERQTMLFSATMPDEVVRIAERHMKLPVRVEVAPSGTLAEHVEHELFVVRKDQKLRLLQKLLEQYHGTVLVFSRTRFGAKRICTMLRRVGVNAAEIHSDRSLAQRRDALDGFRSGKYRVLVATDIASRGIDVTGIELVINYDIPANPDDYIHRVGRTGRAGQAGKAISFAMGDEGEEVRAIEHLAQLYLPVSSLPELPAEPERRLESGDGGERPRFERGRGFDRRRGGGRGFDRGRGRVGPARRENFDPNYKPQPKPAVAVMPDLGISFFEGVAGAPPAGQPTSGQPDGGQGSSADRGGQRPPDGRGGFGGRRQRGRFRR